MNLLCVNQNKLFTLDREGIIQNIGKFRIENGQYSTNRNSTTMNKTSTGDTASNASSSANPKNNLLTDVSSRKGKEILSRYLTLKYFYF